MMAHSHQHHHIARDAADDMDQSLPDSFGGEASDKGGNSARGENIGDGDRQPLYTRTIYMTLAPSFSGRVAGYSTMYIDPSPEPSRLPIPPPQPAPQPPANRQQTTTISSSPPKVKGLSLDASTATVNPSGALKVDTLAATTAKPTVLDSSSVGDQLVSSTSSLPILPNNPTADSSTTQESNDGTNAAKIAGTVFGVLGGVFVVALIAFLLINRRRRKAASHQELHEEKFKGHENPFSAAAAQSEPRAPRISLRPVTQFLPNWNLDKRTSRGAAATLNSSSALAANGRHYGAWERPTTSQSSHPANPFGSQAERVPEPVMEEENVVPRSDPFTANGPVIAAGGLTRKTSMRKEGPKTLDLTVTSSKLGPIPPSPAGTEFSINSVAPGTAMPQSNGAAAIAAAGGPPNSNVHRVQLDFRPSLDDEMELNAGDLVRLLHEYDDGWALVIRLDRSRQGVVPRTCLSTRPVKPRTPPGVLRPGPPINPSGQYTRGPNRPPQGPGFRPTTPQGRPMTPQGAANGHPRMGPGGYGGPGPRPMSPSGRPQSPGPRYIGHAGLPGGRRPQSPVVGNRSADGNSWPGPLNPSASAPAPSRDASNEPSNGPVGRKPVPGQAY